MRFLDYYAGIEAKIVQTILFNAYQLIAYEKIRLAIKAMVVS